MMLSRHNAPKKACGNGTEKGGYGKDEKGKKNSDSSKWIIDRLKGTECCRMCTFRGVVDEKGKARRCKNISCAIGPFCWLHTAIVYHVRAKKSSIPNAGNGLFVDDSRLQKNFHGFKKDDFIAPYTPGDKYRNEAALRRATSTQRFIEEERPTAVYAVNTPGGIVNAHQSNSNPARYANQGSSSGRYRFNAELAFAEDRDEEWIVAIKDIRKGEEIFVDYGEDFEFDAEDREVDDVLPAIARIYGLRERRDRMLDIHRVREREGRINRRALEALWRLGVIPADLRMRKFYSIESIKNRRGVKEKILNLIMNIVIVF